MKKPMKPWFIFFGTATWVVWAIDEDAAFARWEKKNFPRYPDGARWIPPTRDEVHIRAPREADRGWIEQENDPQFLRALPGSMEARTP